MARRPSPWYWPERNGWYTILNDKRHHLADLPADAPPPKKKNGKWVVPDDVDYAFHQFLAKEGEQKPEPKPNGMTIAEIFVKFLDWSKKHNAPATYTWYQERIQCFTNHVGKLVHEPFTAIEPFNVIEWVDSHGDAWSPAGVSVLFIGRAPVQFRMFRDQN